MRSASPIGGSVGRSCRRRRCLAAGLRGGQRMARAHPGAAAGQPRQSQERQRRQAGHQRQYRRGPRRHRQRLGTGAELADQGGVGRSLRAALGHDDAGGGGHQERRDLADQPISHGERGVGVGRVGKGHAVADQADPKAADDVDAGDEQSRHRVAAHEFRGPVHRPVESALLLQLAAAAAGGCLVERAGLQLSVDGHLLARHGVQAEPGRDLGDAPRALGDDHEVHHQQDGEQDQPDHHVAAHEESAERCHHMPGRGRPVLPAAQDQSRGSHVERQAQQRGQQQQRGEAREVERPAQEDRHHQHQHRSGDRQRQPAIEDESGQRHDQHRQQHDHAQRQADIGTGRVRRRRARSGCRHKTRQERSERCEGCRHQNGQTAAYAANACAAMPDGGGGTASPCAA